MDLTAYKVTKYFNGIYYSAMNFSIPQPYRLEYSIGSVTKPKIGRIYVFRTKNAALQFMIYNATTTIMKGIAENIGFPSYVLENFEEISAIESFWNKSPCNIGILTKWAPLETMTCSSFTPTEIVYLERAYAI